MLKHIIAIAFVFACAALAWVVLGATVRFRTHGQDAKLRQNVHQLWGAPQAQEAPTLYWSAGEKRHTLPLHSSRIAVELALDHRRKGLLWYATYRVDFSGDYVVENSTDRARTLVFDFALPDPEAIYDDFSLAVGDKDLRPVQIEEGRLRHRLHLQPGQRQSLRIRYASQGLDQWWYRFGEDVAQVRDFTLVMGTDFDQVDFPLKSMAPTGKKRRAAGWSLEWRYGELFTGVDIGMALPQKLNPGPWVSKVSFAAPVSLFLYFFLLFMVSTLKGIKLHPMHYFFVAAAFFSFHLLLAYLVDHLSVYIAFAASSLVSLLLVTTYLRQAVNARFAFVEAGLAQLVYLVLFSTAFFFEGFAGLAITALSIATLFAAMQLTGRLDWQKAFAGAPLADATP